MRVDRVKHPGGGRANRFDRFFLELRTVHRAGDDLRGRGLEESFDRHYAESNDDVEQRHEQLISLLGEAPERAILHPVASSRF
jgi:hypothetical protein